MKLSAPSSRSSRHQQRGITLIECLVYIGALAVAMGMGMAAYYRSSEHTAALRRNTADITQALAAGELWRADLRAATQPPDFDAGDQTLRITQTNGAVAYRFSDHQILRRATASGEWTVLLPRVQQSEMLREPRQHVTGWRWELELKTYRQEPTTRPLFTFIAVPRLP
jgi:type II secretory pathway pseudopilin PulG